MQKGFSKRLRRMAIASSLLLAGCATNNCNILSTSHSFGCNAMYAALIVPAVPIGLASNAIDNQRDRSRRADTWRRLQANDPATVAHCVLGCYLPEKLSKEAEHAAFERSVEQVIAWWGDHPQPSQMPILMRAYLYKGGTMMTSDPTQAETYLRKAAALSVDPRIAAALNSTEFNAYVYNQPFYDEIAETIQAQLITLRYRGMLGREADPSILKDHCQAVAAWPPAWMKMEAGYNLQRACASAYMQQYHDKLPPSGTPAVIDGVLDPIAPGSSE
ncbi:hypothetical protein SAMN05216570_1038 [Dyella sp. OK004]|uniref:hypothetical protein n=1 Tax=Dyella sp. OK004 TaxID=1855292 RepID=UPI0008E69685|nr:hypothetical protein [Dyella sp. OK004]SFR94721.1 hypothetical protein SAMN05216570_1038 [Dyella sp. OK004]